MLHCLANVKCIYCTGVMLVYTHFSNWTVQKLAFLCQTNLLASLACLVLLYRHTKQSRGETRKCKMMLLELTTQVVVLLYL